MDFQIVSDYPLTGDNTPAIQKLAQGIMMVILFKAFGCNQIGKTFTVHNYIQKLQRLH
jgi:excinuclease UvrABC helicase subunit UvrB